MYSGCYCVFEGMDGSGKSSVMAGVAKRLLSRQVFEIIGPTPIHQTRHPGSTPLGTHLRELVKYPHRFNVEIDDLSRQALYMVDTISFVKTLLEPALNRNEIVLADRSSHISAIVYGTADGIDINDIIRLYSLIVPPKADRVYIFSCPIELALERIHRPDRASQSTGDHYDKKKVEFWTRVCDTYDNLITGPAVRTMAVSSYVALDNIVYVDASQPLDAVIDFVVADMLKLLRQRVD